MYRISMYQMADEVEALTLRGKVAIFAPEHSRVYL
jgi:hypothetical protein